MTIAWMLYTLLVGAFIAIAAAAADWSLRSGKRAVRFVWLGAMALTVAFAVVAPLRGTPVAVRATSNAPLTDVITPAIANATLIERATVIAESAMQMLAQPAQSLLNVAASASPAMNRYAAIVWVASALLVLVLLGAVYTRWMGARRRWPLMQVLGRNVRVAPDVGPAVIGVAPAEIVIPRWVLARPEQEQQLVLEHEGEHVRAGDPLVLITACILLALMPWNVALWYMWSRLRLAVEVDCDQRVLQRGIRKPVYGELLVELSSQRPWMSPLMPAFSWGTSHLEQRLLAMTARPARFVLLRRAACFCVVGGTLLAACQSEMPTSAQIEAMDATTLAARVPLTSDSIVYFVDGKQVAAADAKAIAASDIGSVEILKVKASQGASQVHIRTRVDTLTSGSGNEVVVAGQALRDSATVLSVRTASSDPLPGARIRIRGSSCASTDMACQPLVIVDGKLMEGGMGNINPDTIESVEVIKGAAAARLYGERGANGVISIKLKK